MATDAEFALHMHTSKSIKEFPKEIKKKYSAKQQN